MSHNPDIRSAIYSGAILAATAARPMSREDFECSQCGREHWACECFSLPAIISPGSGACLTSGPVAGGEAGE